MIKDQSWHKNSSADLRIPKFAGAEDFLRTNTGLEEIKSDFWVDRALYRSGNLQLVHT